MIALDTNILVHAHRREAGEHPIAKSLVADMAESPEPWAIPWPCLYEFYSVVTHPKIWKAKASKPAEALAQIAAWIGSPSLRLLHETDSSFPELEQLVSKSKIFGPAIHDARIAALCLAHGVTLLLTADRDFARFPKLKTRNPFTRA